MEHVAPATLSPHAQTIQEGRSNTFPMMIVTLLFFMWGLITSLNDVLIPHLKSIYTLTYVQAMLVQFCFFGACFIVSIPAGILIKRLGYQRGAPFLVPAACYTFILYYGLKYAGMYSNR